MRARLRRPWVWSRRALSSVAIRRRWYRHPAWWRRSSSASWPLAGTIARRRTSPIPAVGARRRKRRGTGCAREVHPGSPAGLLENRRRDRIALVRPGAHVRRPLAHELPCSRAQRVRAARLAISRRRSGLSADARAGPPFNPPRRPSAAACGLRWGGAARRSRISMRSVGALHDGHEMPMVKVSAGSSMVLSCSHTRQRRRTRSTVHVSRVRICTVLHTVGSRARGIRQRHAGPTGASSGAHSGQTCKMLVRSRNA